MVKTIETSNRGIKYNKAGFVKYSNRLFPRFETEIWTVWENNGKGKCFRKFEEAIIYQKLLDIEKNIKKLPKGE